MEGKKKQNSIESTKDETLSRLVTFFAEQKCPAQEDPTPNRNNNKRSSGSAGFADKRQNSNLKTSQGQATFASFNNRNQLVKNEEPNWRQRNEPKKDQNSRLLTEAEKHSRQLKDSSKNENNRNINQNVSGGGRPIQSGFRATQQNHDYSNRANKNENQARRDQRNSSHRNDGQTKNHQDNWRRDSNRNQNNSEYTNKKSNNEKSSNRNWNFNRNDQKPSYDNQQSFTDNAYSQKIEKTASTDVTRFWEKLSKRVLNSKFELHTDEYSLWLETWNAAAGGAQGPIRMLPLAYLRLPAITDISPPPIVIINVLRQVVNLIKLTNQVSGKQSYNHNDFSTTNILEAVLDIIKLRLINQVQSSQISNIDSLTKAVNELDNILLPTIMESMRSSSQNDIIRLADLIKRKGIEINELHKKIKENASNHPKNFDEMQLENIERPPWLGWQHNPTLDWLMSGSWHLVDGLKANYESSEEYSESLLKLWTLLTFYWGSGAVWPRCTHKQGGDNSASASDVNVCGEPMLTATNIGSCKKCGGNASWKCFRNSHDHICKKCLIRLQDALVGSPGPQASTDIYDAVIEREVVRREETVYLLKNVESRKPPKIAPNWKTSYRLPISVLVAVIKLSVSHEPIQRSSSIQWGEIVPYDIKSGANQDWSYRSKGCMAIRLLNRANCVGMPDETDAYFDLGVRVAVIDLRVFVPEVISVLNTFAKKDFKYQLDQIPFFERLIGHGSTQNHLEFNPNESLLNHISYALENSEIDYIQRLDPLTKTELIREICALKPIQSLSGTQLEAFAAGLYSSVHCTQGPPGTGKSYIGVCLVLALDLIRSKAESRGHPVGPVLVLSYKNHALDEFLIDVITQYEASFRRHLQPGMLIRTGKPDLESLERFTEKHSPMERFAKDNLERIISVQKNVRSVVKELLECARSMEISLDLDWTSQLYFLKNSDQKSPMNCYSSKVLCATLTMYCLMNDYEKANHENVTDENLLIENDHVIPVKRRKLADLSEHEMKNVFKGVAFDILEKLTLNAFSAEMESFSQTILNFIVGLSKGLEHWKIPHNLSPVYFYTNSWLKGKNPPPRCKAYINEVLCIQEAAENSSFCHLLHKCNSTDCKNQRILPNTPFCLEHLCQYQDCKFERFRDSKFCSKHICPACILTNSKEIKSRHPFACIDHECIVNNCNKLQVYPYYGFCIEHVCTECAITIETKEHFPPLNGKKLCNHHKCFVNDCGHKRLNDAIWFCHYHVCRLCNANEVLNGADILCPQSQLCTRHRCVKNMCFDPKYENSSYCVNHSCKGCVVLKCFPIEAADEKAPRNSCKMHSLCHFVSGNGKLCNELANKPTLYCNEHQELKIQKAFIENYENKACSCNNSKGNPCGAKLTKKIYDKWYCRDHEKKAPQRAVLPEKEEESSDEDDTEAENINIQRADLLPVLKVENPIDVLKKIKCNGTFSKGDKCDVVIFRKDDSNIWFCPLHEQRIQKSKPLETRIDNEIEITKPKPKSTQDSSKKEQLINNESKPIQTVNSELKDFEESLKPVINSGIKNNPPEIEEDYDFGEALAANMNPDELDVYDDDGEDQQNEELKRLQEITEIADYSDEEEIEEEIKPMTASSLVNANQTVEVDAYDHLSDVQNWSWNLSHQDRLIAAAKLIRLVCNLCKRLNKIITENDLHTARKTFAEAGAQSFRSARIVGSTVVGASRRLEALRSAGPFAVVIEEACEVIEPTLMSVLAVNTLRKLEMIGDHRQLPAFVQQCWFNFETTIPSIKTSLFERLISGSVKSSHNRSSHNNTANAAAAAILPHTVLDEQRRMRSSIADITRPDYTDLVQILDHKHTARQCIGDVVIRSCVDKKQATNTAVHRKGWADKGRSVPGISENVYFWNLLNNSESRPVAGLSACNQTEAEAVACLTKWLLICGCPPASISIITPYKGQKNTIIAALKKKECLPPYRPDKPPQRGTTLTISTVDKYQGDENDIVILSLVRCSPGNRFVGLQNRFVVATSRARLGFFVIGSVKAVVTNRNGSEGPSHWRRFISSLNPKEDKEKQSADDSRCGNELPICCPRHGKQVKLNVTKLSDFPVEKEWNKFCSLACQVILDRCGHLCKLPCHSPIDAPHNTKCMESLERPCETHQLVPLLCYEVDIAYAAKETLVEALKRFECKEKVGYCRPECGHIIKIECFVKKQIDNGETALDDCKEIVSDYIHPVCNHRFKQPKCATKRKYELNAPKCPEKVLHKRICGCKLMMQCHESIEETAQPRTCTMSVDIARPRCGHMLSLRCFEAEHLKEEWSKQTGKSVITHGKMMVVMHDEIYGPPESFINPKILQCQVPVAYMAQCGHIMTKIPCSSSFEYASGLKKSPECSFLTEFLCPVCRLAVKNECWLSQSLHSVNIWKDEGVLNKTESGDICISEASSNTATLIPEFSSRIEKLLPKLCNSILTFQRICSPKHTVLINCYQLIEILAGKKKLKPCSSPIDRILPCKHITSVECNKKNQNPPPKCEAKVEEIFTYSCGVHVTKPKLCCDLERLKEANPRCCQQITCSRFRCSHKVTIPCFLKKSAQAFLPGIVLPAGQSIIYSDIEYCDPENDIPACNELVNYLYKHCGHLRIGIKCSEAFSWAANNEKQLKCTEAIEFRNPTCGHLNKALCFEADLMHSWNPWDRNEAAKPKLTEYVINHDEENKPIIAYSMDEKILELKPPPKEVSKEALICHIPYLLNRKCGHSLLTTCSAVYWQTYSPCEDPVTIECGKADCKYKCSLACHVYETEKRTGKKSVCKNTVSRLCKKCMLNKIDVECFQVVVECNVEVSCTLPCNHEVHWLCGEDEDPREKPANCQSCILTKWERIIKSDVSVESNQQLIKQIKTKIDKFLADNKNKNIHINKRQEIPLPTDFGVHDNCRREIMSRYLNNARTKFINISPPEINSLASLDLYELVFFEVPKKKTKVNNDSFYFEQTDTEYGRGYKLFQLNKSGLQNCEPDSDGLIHIFVGAAFRFNIAPHSPPYLGTEGKNAQKKANKLSTSQKQKGFDCIQSSPNESEVKKFVFWEPGSCIQLNLLSLEICKQCQICLDYYSDEKGYLCSKKHFLCWDCFEQHVNQAAGPDSVGKCVDNEGCLLCPECSESITLLNVAKESVPKKVFDLLENLKAKIKITKAVNEALKDQETRLRKEFERIQAIQDREEQMAERLRLEIIEDILTLRCPRCKLAFIDYSGCAALTCAKCKAGFCALCLKDCGHDAHQHVVNCPENIYKNVFVTEEQFNRINSKRREKHINDKIKDQTNKTKTLLYKKMEKDFRDLGIQVNFQLKDEASSKNNSNFFSNLRDKFNF